MEPMSAANPALSCNALSCGYPGKLVLKDVTFELRPGSVVALLGPNGSGKSTLLRTITGEIPPLEGSLAICGRPAETLSARERAQLAAFVPSEERTEFPFLVREIVAMGRIPHSEGLFDSKEDDEIVLEAMRQAECEALAEQPVTQVSAGERQRALLARALAQRAPILLLDEPTSHLDPGHQVTFAKLVRRLSDSGLAVLVALHDLNLAAHIATEALLLHGGAVACAGPVDAVLSSQALDHAYGASFERIKGSDGILRLSPEFLSE
jgi:iron complex transport system ATP-binding protein